MDQPTSEVTDPNEMRKMIRKLSIFGHMNPDEPPGLNMVAIGCSSMVRNIFIAAKQRGLTEEDAITMVAYYAIKANDDLYGRFLDHLKHCHQHPIFIPDSQKSNATAQKT